ncbi:MAG: hypothetical protein E6J91_38570 [Deltaproteobacteria bacterium]|nr:MAG: hypothetical protein E6J91_38570 [Deltaproteobacteria bacterium]
MSLIALRLASFALPPLAASASSMIARADVLASTGALVAPHATAAIAAAIIADMDPPFIATC